MEQNTEHKNSGKRWTKEEDAILINRWGTKRPKNIAAILGRTLSACKRRMYVLAGTKRMNRGGYSVRSLAKETGYHYSQIRRAIKALRLEKRVRQKGKHKSSTERRWGKSWDNRTWLITYENAERIIEWLKHDSTVLDKKWARGYVSCIHCNGTERKHYGGGCCSRCYREPLKARLRKETAERRAQRAKWWDPTRETYKCIHCESSKRPHHGKGLCDNCYQKNLCRLKRTQKKAA